MKQYLISEEKQHILPPLNSYELEETIFNQMFSDDMYQFIIDRLNQKATENVKIKKEWKM